MKTHYFVLLFLTPVFGIVLAAGAIVFVVSRVLPDFAPPPLADVPTAEVEMYQWFEDGIPTHLQTLPLTRPATTAQLSKVKPVQAPTATNVTPSGRGGKTQHYTLAQTASTSFREPTAEGVRVRQPARRARPHRARAAKPAVNNDARYNNDALGDLSIAGRVLNQHGQPVPNIKIFAHTFAASMDDTRQQIQGLSGEDGVYEIVGLLEGEYEIRTVETALYPSQRMIVAAGFHSADIVLTGRLQEVRIFGTVTDTHSVPLAGVEVIPGHVNLKTLTDENGNYEVYLMIREDRSYGFRFEMQGYSKERIPLLGRDFVGVEEMRLDAQLIAEAKTITVSGSVQGDDGKPVAGAVVRLSSPGMQTHYHNTTDADGHFTIPKVESSPDYSMKVSARAGYEDYTQESVDVGEDDFSLDVVLTSLEMGRLSGRMVDVNGDSIPNFQLWLRSKAAKRSQPLSVTGDHSGVFVVDEAPAGQLMFMTRSIPRIHVNGLTLEAEQEQEVLLVLDWGEYEMDGQVTDDRGEPIPGAQVKLSWSDNNEGLHSSATRSTVTDDTGRFKFTQLGPGRHQLRVQSPGYHSVQESHEVTNQSWDVEVRLEPLPG